MRKRLTTSSIWLGLFAMLMIHVGPLYSAVQLAQAPAHQHGEPHSQAHHPSDSQAHGHHGKAAAGEPAWLAALELCGYCELLTLNPPLSLSLTLVLPQHQPVQAAPLPDPPLRSTLRYTGSYPRAPPVHFHS